LNLVFNELGGSKAAGTTVAVEPAEPLPETEFGYEPDPSDGQPSLEEALQGESDKVE
jgi:hypothetical protein